MGFIDFFLPFYHSPGEMVGPTSQPNQAVWAVLTQFLAPLHSAPAAASRERSETAFARNTGGAPERSGRQIRTSLRFPKAPRPGITGLSDTQVIRHPRHPASPPGADMPGGYLGPPSLDPTIKLGFH